MAIKNQNPAKISPAEAHEKRTQLLADRYRDAVRTFIETPCGDEVSKKRAEERLRRTGAAIKKHVGSFDGANAAMLRINVEILREKNTSYGRQNA